MSTIEAHMNGRVRRLIVSGVLASVALAGCARLPPQRPATDLKAIAGTWHGWFVLMSGYRFDGTLTIREDGTVELIVPALSNPGPRFPGRVRVQEGRYRWKSDTTGREGTYTLHADDDRRVLVSHADDGVYAEWTPAK
jgi:hypothetical protein